MNAIERKPAMPVPVSAGPDAMMWEGHMADDVSNTYGPDPLAALSATADLLVRVERAERSACREAPSRSLAWKILSMV